MSTFRFVGEPFHRKAPEAYFGIAVADLGGADSLTFSVYHRNSGEDAWALLRRADIHAGASEVSMRAGGIKRILRHEVAGSGPSSCSPASLRLLGPTWLPAPEQGRADGDPPGGRPARGEEESR